jgi:hypothetical protein
MQVLDSDLHCAPKRVSGQMNGQEKALLPISSKEAVFCALVCAAPQAQAPLGCICASIVLLLWTSFSDLTTKVDNPLFVQRLN